MARKTLDQKLGVLGLSISAVIGTIISLVGGNLGELIFILATAAGVSAFYYLIKYRKNPEIKNKEFSWTLIIIWIIIFAIKQEILKL